MAEDNFTLTTFYTWWKAYQDHLEEALAPLTAEQLALRAAPGLRSLGELAAHVVRARVSWFHGFLGEGGEDLVPLAQIGAPGTPAPDAAELVRGLDITWAFIADALGRWSSADMRKTFGTEWRGNHYELSRAWVVWHVLEHDLHHGGEISLTLGMHDLQAPDI